MFHALSSAEGQSTVELPGGEYSVQLCSSVAGATENYALYTGQHPPTETIHRCPSVLEFLFMWSQPTGRFVSMGSAGKAQFTGCRNGYFSRNKPGGEVVMVSK